MRKALQGLFLALGLCWGMAATAAVEIAGVKVEEGLAEFLNPAEFASA
ncbi:MAG: hypothetical protein L6Q63_16885 [Giesbergeria sp.]|nr:hypothetical protein [Giesbergeria sp.]